jgi:hypothetical protein
MSSSFCIEGPGCHHLPLDWLSHSSLCLLCAHQPSLKALASLVLSWLKSQGSHNLLQRLEQPSAPSGCHSWSWIPTQRLRERPGNSSCYQRPSSSVSCGPLLHQTILTLSPTPLSSRGFRQPIPSVPSSSLLPVHCCLYHSLASSSRWAS